jgi:alkylated DNA repair protein (DNA oxidative demethylase)
MEPFDEPAQGNRILGTGAVLLSGFASGAADELLAAVKLIERQAPFRRMTTPGGWQMSVAMTNCGACGWITDQTGYRYVTHDPQTDQPWPAMPGIFQSIAREAAEEAGYQNFQPDTCLINRYEPGARLSLHQDRNERDMSAPIVSVSLGLPATFLWGGQQRSQRPTRLRLIHGDVMAWGGPDRLTFHGVEPLSVGDHPDAGPFRFNLTFRRAS